MQKIINAATKWRDASQSARQRAINETVEAPNRWTEQALDHAVDRWMESLTLEAVDRWIGDAGASWHGTVGVLHGEAGPLSGFRDALVVWALGLDYVGRVPESSPALLPAFAEAVRAEGVEGSIRFDSTDTVCEEADLLIAEEGEEGEGTVQEACNQHDIPESQRLIRSPVYSVGVVDGHESEDEMGRLAEDMLLFEGEGRRRLALLWAPRDHSPDAYLEAMARFRGLFPAHEDTPGTLQMQQAFLEARDQPHAYAEGLEFLVSRGDPTPQRAGHIRWTEYDDFGEVDDWLSDHSDEVYVVVARPHLHDQLPDDWSVRTPGGVHVPPLDDEEGRAIVQFLQAGAITD
ncbi:hypothetical protein BSZ35_01870 [Salinibacter sp. 10B]|nr:hypothetical protein BSZ35_01870 [Salinibacter sp. 10B]